MLKLRLKRYGKKNSPSYKIGIIDNKIKRDGHSVEELGFYNPISKKITINVNRAVVRIQQGAQASNTVKNLLIKAGIIVTPCLPYLDTDDQ